MLSVWPSYGIHRFGYKAESEITKDTSGGILKDNTKGLYIGMFILPFLYNVGYPSASPINLQANNCPEGYHHQLSERSVAGAELKGILGQALSGMSLDEVQYAKVS